MRPVPVPARALADPGPRAQTLTTAAQAPARLHRPPMTEWSQVVVPRARHGPALHGHRARRQGQPGRAAVGSPLPGVQLAGWASWEEAAGQVPV